MWKVGPSLGRSQHLSWKVHWAILVAVGELVGDTRWELFSPRAPGRGTRAAERPPPCSGFRVLAEFGQLVTQLSVVPDPRGTRGWTAPSFLEAQVARLGMTRWRGL